MRRYNARTRHYIMVAGEPYAIDTLEQIDRAAAALYDIGQTEAQVWHGHPECPDSYQDSARKVFASEGEI